MALANKRTLFTIAIIVIGSAFAMTHLSRYALDVSLHDWYDGAAGYKRALAEQARSGQPIALFFHADWCKSCQKLRESVLSTTEVKQFMSGYIRVKIEPEKEKAAKMLANEYGVIGFPTFFIVPKSGNTIRLRGLGNITSEQFMTQTRQVL